MKKRKQMKPGDYVYVVYQRAAGEMVRKLKIEEIGPELAILRGPSETITFETPGVLTIEPLENIYATEKEAEASIPDRFPKVGDYVACVEWNTLIKGLVLKVNPKTVEVLLSDEDDIRRNRGKAKLRHPKWEAVTLLRNNKKP